VFYCEILCKCICWLIIKAILRNVQCSNKDSTSYIQTYPEKILVGLLTRSTKFYSKVQPASEFCLKHSSYEIEMNYSDTSDNEDNSFRNHIR
jgi:hypothetical protein